VRGEERAPRGVAVSLRNAREIGRDPLAFYSRLTLAGGRYRDLARFDLFGENLLVNDPEAAGRVLTSPPEAGEFSKEGLRYFRVLRRLLRRGLFTSEGEFHLRQRRRLQPVFQRGPVEELAAGITEAIGATAARWERGAGTVVDVQQAMLDLALDALAAAVVGPDLRDAVRRFAPASEAAERRLLATLAAPVLLPAWVPTPANRGLGAAARDVHAIARGLVARRRDTLQAGAAPDALLTRLLRRELAGPAMGEAQLRDEVVTLLVGGYESTAQALTWTWYLLAAHPEAAGRLREETRAVLAGRPAAPGDVPRLPYARMVVDEALRLYPPVWAINRRALRDGELRGRRVRRGAVLTVCPYTLHRHPGHWARPGAFDPGHFAPDQRRAPHAYLPFGAGRHRCLGVHFALLTATLAVATLAQRFAFAPPDRLAEPATGAFTYPRHGLRLRLLASP
jgi:cytochrome P450